MLEVRRCRGSCCWSERARAVSCSRATGPARLGRARARTARAGRSTTRPRRGSGAIYAAAASEWHGAGVWRSGDLGETWELSSEGLAVRRRRPEAVEGLGPDGGARPRARRRRGGRHVREPRRRRDLVAAEHARRPARPRRLERSRQAAARPSRPARRSCRTPTRPARFWAVVQGYGIFETTDDGASWTPRNKGLRADWPLEDPEVGYCVHKLVMSPVDHEPPLPAEPRRHAPQRRRRAVVGRDHRGAADRVRLRRRRASARSRQLLRDPARPGPRPLHARRAARPSGARATRRLELAAARARAAAARRAPRRAARRARDRRARRARALLRHQHGAGVRERGRGRELERDRELPARDLLGRGGGARE